MKAGTVIGLIVVVALVIFGFYFFDFNVTEQGSLPDVDVTVEGGSMPETEIEAGDIETGTEEVTVTVPTIEVESPEENADTSTN